jgi:hypothetical protein
MILTTNFKNEWRVTLTSKNGSYNNWSEDQIDDIFGGDRDATWKLD